MAGSHTGARWSRGDLKRLEGAGGGNPGDAERRKLDSERSWIVSLLLIPSSSTGMSSISSELGDSMLRSIAVLLSYRSAFRAGLSDRRRCWLNDLMVVHDTNRRVYITVEN